MKRSYLPQILGAGAVAASLAFTPLTLPAQAQTDSNTNTTTTESTTPSQEVNAEDDGFDWGWLGLLGLAGLAGLAGRKNERPAAYRDPDVADRSTTVR